MKISIAMTTYNGAKYVETQLDSFATQTRLPDEIVICDDGSTDLTTSIIEKFSERVPFVIKLVKNKNNIGYIKNFEKALTLCEGDLIFLADQDDVWFSEKIEYIERIFKENYGKLLIIHDGHLVDEHLQGNEVTKLGQVRAGWGDDQHFITGALSIIHKDLKKYILPIPDEVATLFDVGHDGWIHLIARYLGVRHVTEKSLQLIRRHTSNTSEWIASSTTKINKLAVFHSNRDTTPANSYKDRIYLNVAANERLKKIKDIYFDEINLPVISESIKFLKAESLAIHNREDIVGAGAFSRRGKSLLMLLKGRYSHFNGMRSFLRDMVR